MNVYVDTLHVVLLVNTAKAEFIAGYILTLSHTPCLHALAAAHSSCWSALAANDLASCEGSMRATPRSNEASFATVDPGNAAVCCCSARANNARHNFNPANRNNPASPLLEPVSPRSPPASGGVGGGLELSNIVHKSARSPISQSNASLASSRKHSVNTTCTAAARTGIGVCLHRAASSKLFILAR
jgi:hypothetical protein